MKSNQDNQWAVFEEIECFTDGNVVEGGGEMGTEMEMLGFMDASQSCLVW